jgi:hypothetical protein
MASLARNSQSPDEEQIVEEIRALAERCEGAVHLYLKFIGD